MPGAVAPDGIRTGQTDYVLPLEDARAQAAYGMHSAINQMLIMRGDRPGRTSVVLVKDAIGI